MIVNYPRQPNTRVRACVVGDSIDTDSAEFPDLNVTNPANTPSTNGETGFVPGASGAYGTIHNDGTSVVWSIYCFSTKVYESEQIARTRNGQAVRSDLARRQLLEQLANHITPDELATFNADGVLPARVNLHSLGAD
jgi:hypothetical protein